MKAVLSLVKTELYHYVNGKRVEGVPTGLLGDVSGLLGDVSDLRGDVSGLRGDVIDLRGDVSGLFGNVTGLRGDVDEAEITDKEREKGVNVKDLIK